jgi:hypothetical protein
MTVVKMFSISPKFGMTPSALRYAHFAGNRTWFRGTSKPNPLHQRFSWKLLPDMGSVNLSAQIPSEMRDETSVEFHARDRSTDWCCAT